MKVIVAAGGRFHAIRLAQELYKRNALHQLISGSFTQADISSIDPALVTSFKSCQIIDQIIWRTRLAKLIQPSRLYVAKDAWFDFQLKKALRHLAPFDIFVGWAHYFLGSIDAIRSKAKIVIVESGSCHIEVHEQLIVDEYRRLKLPVAHLPSANRNKILKEYAASDYIMTPSTFARASFIAKGFAPDKILQIPCGMDIDYFSASNQAQRSPDFFRLLFVGQLQIGKGIATLLEAWRSLNLDATKAELLLVGNMQKDVRILLERTQLPSGVRIIPGVTRATLKKLYEQSHAFVLPSVQDGFGMVLGEAMATGLPVIASLNSGGPDIITHGVNGLLVPASNTQALADAIMNLYKDRELRTALGRAGMQHIQQFSWQRYGDSTVSTYQQILDTHEKSSRPARWQVQP